MLELELRDGTRLQFEHSLLSVSKWEAKTKKAFLGRDQKNHNEMLDYYQMMLTSPEQDPNLVYALSPAQMEELTNYMNSTPYATMPPEPDPDARRHAGDVLTSDVIYMQMTLLRIPWHPAETWHLNRLLLQIALVADRQKPPKKQNKVDMLKSWMHDNEKNKAFFKSEG